MLGKIGSTKTNRVSVLKGMASIRLFPRKDYTKHISNSGKLMKKSWERTGLTLKQAMDKVGGDDDYGKTASYFTSRTRSQRAAPASESTESPDQCYKNGKVARI